MQQSIMGKDTTRAFREEIDSYRKELANPYLVDKQVLEKTHPRIV